MLRRALLASTALLALSCAPALAQSTAPNDQNPLPVVQECWTGTAYIPCNGANAGLVAGSVLTRASNTTAYTATSTAPQTWCLFANTTACVPGTFSFNKTIINRLTLQKSGSSTTNATFIVWLFSATPGVASPAQYDATSYTGPRIADMPNYIGNAACSTAAANSDSSPGVWYECTLSNPNTSGALNANSSYPSGTIYYLITVTGAYTPLSAETLTPYIGGLN